MKSFYLAMADVVLAAHAGIVLFVLGGFVLIWIGYFARWSYVRNFWFRVAHLTAMGFVAVQTLLGAACPLTVWENQLRARAGETALYEETFIGHWVGRCLFFEAPPWVFTAAYTMFFALVVLSWICVKPVWPRRKGPGA